MVTVILTNDQIEVIRWALADHIEYLHDECRNYDGTEEGDIFWSEFHIAAAALRAVADAAKLPGN